MDSPVIGLLVQEVHLVKDLVPDTSYEFYIAASYVKYLESGGARVIPVWLGQDESYYKKIIDYTNGLLIPGGGTYFTAIDKFTVSVCLLFELAKQSNENNKCYPIFGICLGMQALAYATTGKDIRVDCLCKNKAASVQLEQGYHHSYLFRNNSKFICDLLIKENVTYHFHKYCLTMEAMDNVNISNQWKILASNTDANGLKYISIMENTNYPFIGVQFHPEKNRFEHFKKLEIPQSLNAHIVSQYFASVFVDLCRQNSNTFPSTELLGKALIYNYSPIYSGQIKGSKFSQLYLFQSKDIVSL